MGAINHELTGLFFSQTVLSGEVYTCTCFLIDMVNVSLELKDPKGKEGAGSLARYGSSYTLFTVTVILQ